MTDRELLEMASKAAGIKIDRESDSGSGLVDSDDFYWNPLSSDGDALRIAADLSFDLHINQRHVEVFSGDLDDCIDQACIDGDIRAATRRAIVRAAAAIGSAV